MIPKFRVRDKENKKMLVVNDICNLFWENTFLECYELVPDPKGKREYELINHRIDFEDCVLMQSTGLLDVNGKEIFEGDVVFVRDELIEFGPGVYEVVYSQDHLGWMFYDKENHDFCFISTCTWDELEIIGNAHQNPELVEDLE
ncbi:TPA: hypothetical protein U1U99_000190 [Streptococcus suis]|uniref:YopX family protein n=1 Tax=Streptococcus suis TaxID=1307 RepID=UPI0009451068|nr:YopX family protein [Streptococcus suis]HEL2721207.1 hypothetical protein [Streptococcus suis]HEM3869017.1 hypothetical protein [Streptococcus suis]HEM3890553.1 hypothetical protein [Streptococcus suis]